MDDSGETCDEGQSKRRVLRHPPSVPRRPQHFAAVEGVILSAAGAAPRCRTEKPRGNRREAMTSVLSTN
jgi:hypothetical protein